MNELSDKNKPRKLENIFREGMGEAEIMPSDRLWERIDHKLDTKEAVFYKERLVWFQRLAAACVVLVLFAGGYLFYDYRAAPDSQIAVVQQSPTEQSSQTNNATQIEKITPDREVEQPQIVADNLLASENEKALAAKALREPIAIRVYSAREVHTRDKNNVETVTITKPMLEAENLINASQPNSTIKSINEVALTLVNESQFEETNEKNKNGQIAIKSRAGLENKSGISDTSTIAIRKSEVYATESAPASVKKEALNQQSSRWTLSGKYASHYFDQNIALAENRSAVNNSQANFGAPLANTNSSNFAEALHEYDNNTMPSYSYNTSLGAAYQINNNWALETGVDYTQNVATTTSSFIFNNSQFSSRYNSLTPNTNEDKSNVVGVPTTALVASLSGSADVINTGVVKTQAFETQYRYRFIGIPIKMNYKTNGEKSFYYISGGVLTNFLMQAHILSASPLVPDIKYAANTESPFQNWQMAATASVGKGFKISKSFSLKAGLEASKYLTSLAANPEYLEGKHGKPYTIGIALSSSYTLGK